MYYAEELHDGISKMSCDDLTYDTMTVGSKSNHWKTKQVRLRAFILRILQDAETFVYLKFAKYQV